MEIIRSETEIMRKMYLDEEAARATAVTLTAETAPV